MARWEPNARERLREAAMELFERRGYDRVTVGDIAARAKLAERTFFRYFSDKREVLFSGTEDLEKVIVNTVAAAPKKMAPLDVVIEALAATSVIFESRREFAPKRMALIAAHAELHERELIKSAKLASLLSEGLRARGMNEAAADLLASTGMVLFGSAFAHWVEDRKKRDFAHHMRDALAELRRVTAEGVAPRREIPPKPREKRYAVFAK